MALANSYQMACVNIEVNFVTKYSHIMCVVTIGGIAAQVPGPMGGPGAPPARSRQARQLRRFSHGVDSQC